MEEHKHKAKMSFKQSTFGFLRGYYILTPVFLFLELLWRFSFRVPFLLAVPNLRYLYYGFCFSCGVVCYFRPKATPIVALTESTTNIVLVFAGYMAAYSDAIFVVAETGNIPAILTIKGTLSFAVPVTVGVVGFYHCQDIVNRTLKEKTKP